MRTSNKLLLGIFVGPLIIITCIHLALYAKYKSGNYVAMKTVQEDRFAREHYKSISSVAVYGLNNFHIIPSDSVKLDVEKDKNGHLHYTLDGSTLLIHGDSTTKNSDGSNSNDRSYQSVNLYLPVGTTITADNSEITLHGTKDSLKAQAYHFSLVNDASLKIDQDGDDSTHVYFKSLGIDANHSSGIELSAHARVFDLQLTAIESAFTDNGASIDKLTIDADKISNITLKGDNLKKLNMMKQP